MSAWLDGALVDRRVLLGLMVMGAAGAALGGLVLQFVGVGLLLFAAPPVIAPAFHATGVGDRLRRYGPAIALGLVFVLLCGELLLGRPPATRDHGIHYFQTHLWVHDLLPRGRLNGWSGRLNHGYPYGDSYPVIGYVLMSALHVLTLGIVSLRASYAWGLAALWLGSALAVWWVAQTAANEVFARREDAREAPREGTAPAVPWDRWAGSLAAIAWLVDPGAARQGGWNYLMFHGVWPQQLSTALWLVTIPLTLALWREPTPRRIGLLALATAGSVMAHPFGLLTCAFTAVAIPAVALVAEGRHAFAPGAIRSHALACALGGLGCAATVVVFLASAKYMGRGPVPWLAWPELAAQLVTGEPFRAHRALIGPAALLGAVAVMRRGRSGGWIAVICVVGLMLLASEAAISGLRLDLLVSGFKNLQFPRYSIAIKPVWFALAGVGAAVVAEMFARRRFEGWWSWWRGTPDGRTRPAAWARLLACIALAPVVAGAATGIRDAVPRPVGALHTLEGTHHGVHEQRLTQALSAEADAADSRLRVAFLRRGMSGGTYPLFAIADADADLAMDSHIPSVNFIYRLEARDPEALDALGTTHVIFDRPLPLDEGRLEDRLEVVGTFGDYQLARLVPPTNGSAAIERGVVRPETPVVLDTTGFTVQVPVEAIETARGRVRVEVPVAAYRKWVATGPGGRRLKITPRRMYGRSFTGMTVQVAEPGPVRFDYQRPSAETATAWASGAAWLVALVALVFGRAIPWRARLRDGVWPGRIALAGVGLAVIVGATVVPRVQHHKLERTWTELMQAHARASSPRGAPERGAMVFDRDLTVTGEIQVWTEHEDRCDGMLTKDARAGCSDRAQRPHVASIYRRPYLYRCVAVTVPARGEAQLIVEDLEPDESVFGIAERLTHGSGAKSLTIETSDPEDRARTLRRRRDFAVLATAREVPLVTIDLKNDHEDPQTLCVALAVGHAE